MVTNSYVEQHWRTTGLHPNVLSPPAYSVSDILKPEIGEAWSMILHGHMVKTRMPEPHYPHQTQANPESITSSNWFMLALDGSLPLPTQYKHVSGVPCKSAIGEAWSMILHEHMVKSRMPEPHYPHQNQAKPECFYNMTKMFYVNHNFQLVYASTGWLSTVANTFHYFIKQNDPRFPNQTIPG